MKPATVKNGLVGVHVAGNADSLRAVLPHATIAKRGTDTLLAVRHGLDETYTLREAGYDVPSPINYGWQYPGVYVPRDNQRHTAAFATLNHRAYIFNAMRTGKSAASLWAAEYLIQNGYVRNVLVVCPRDCVRDVWEREIMECLPHRSVSCLIGPKKRRFAELAKGAEFAVINYDGLTTLSEITQRGGKKIIDCVALRGRFDLVVFDEAHVVANHRTECHRALQSLLLPQTWLWLLTGTPVGTQLSDTWGLLQLVGNRSPARSWTQYRNLLMYQVSQFQWRNKIGAEKQVYEWMQPAIRFSMSDCLDLPKVDEMHRGGELNVEQRKAYWQMQREGLMLQKSVSDPEVTAKNAAIKLSKMLQISCGAVRSDDGQSVNLHPRPRVDALEAVFAELGVTAGRSLKKTIVAVPFTFAMEVLQHMLTERGYRSAIINGTVPESRRHAVLNGWRGDEYDVLIVHPQVTAHGLDLTAAESIVYFAPIFGSNAFAQLNMRIQGERQQGRPAIVYLSCTQLERNRYNALKKGVETSEELLAEYNQALTEEII
jgi:SNF2 family DNA or RNA helicase